MALLQFIDLAHLRASYEIVCMNEKAPRMGLANPHWHTSPRGVSTPPLDEPPPLSATAHGFYRFYARTVAGWKYHDWRTSVSGRNCLVPPTAWVGIARLSRGITPKGSWRTCRSTRAPECSGVLLCGCQGAVRGDKRSSHHTPTEKAPTGSGIKKYFSDNAPDASSRVKLKGLRHLS